ncbi:MAG TPA: hypothetical protein VN643_01770 [Pyrinomonadaceae bacterium]|nr:hypothetical protein [Pyrinomonadaceae bacterium]
MTTVSKNSFINFLYPFRFESSSYAELIQTTDSLRATTKQGDLPLWSRETFAEEDLLPHVARYLNNQDDSSPTARLWQMNPNALNSPFFFGANADWDLHTSHGELRFVIENLELVLFRAGVGFLIIRARPVSESLSNWQDFIHYFRYLRRLHQVNLRAQRRIGIDTVTRTPVYEPYTPPLLENRTSNSPVVLGEILTALLTRVAKDGEQWWEEVFVAGQLIPFVALGVNELTSGDAPALLYKMRNFFHSGQGQHPGSDDLRHDHHSLLPYAERQWFTTSLDGGAFVGVDMPDTPFFQQTLTDHLRNQYFLLFLLTQHQRFILMDLSSQVSQHWLHRDDVVRAAAFERIRDALLDFTARGYFAQVMQREHHHRYYKKLQNELDLARLYREVRDEVTEMHNYLQMKRTAQLQELAEAQKRDSEEQRRHMEAVAEDEARRDRRLEKRLSLIGLIVGAPVLIMSFLSINLLGFTSNEGLPLRRALLLIATLSVVLIAIVAVLFKVFPSTTRINKTK